MSVASEIESLAMGYEFSDIDYEYATILALKILDNQCNMDAEDKTIFMIIYDTMTIRDDKPLNKKVHAFIEEARIDGSLKLKEEYKDAIHTIRVEYMERMEKEDMKAYKARMRQNLCGII